MVRWLLSHSLWPITMQLLANLTKSYSSRTKEGTSQIIRWRTMILLDCTWLNWIVWLLKICLSLKRNFGLLHYRCTWFYQIHPYFQRDLRKSSSTHGLDVRQWSSSTLNCKISISNSRNHSRLCKQMEILLPLSWSNQCLSLKKAQLRLKSLSSSTCANSNQYNNSWKELKV